jgi:hypothetical protein
MAGIIASGFGHSGQRLGNERILSLVLSSAGDEIAGGGLGLLELAGLHEIDRGIGRLGPAGDTNWATR